MREQAQKMILGVILALVLIGCVVAASSFIKFGDKTDSENIILEVNNTTNNTTTLSSG